MMYSHSKTANKEVHKMTTQTALELITVTETFKAYNPENIYTLHTDKELSIITKKPLQGSDKNKFSLSLRVADTDATFSKIVNGSDKCISVKIASAKTIVSNQDNRLVAIQDIYGKKPEYPLYTYQNKVFTDIAYSKKSDMYRLIFADKTTEDVTKFAQLLKVAIAVTPAPKKPENTISDPDNCIHETLVPTPATKLTIDMVYELALQLKIADQSRLASKINNNISDKLSTQETTQQTSTQETSIKKKLDKEYPVHYDRLVTWLENKYQGVEIKDILINWGDKEIQGIEKLTDKKVSLIVSVIEGQEIGSATVREELATICYLKALEHGVLIPYLTKIGATVSDMLKKLSSTKQAALHTQILKRWEDKKINFATLNNACKAYSKSNPELILRVMIGQAELPKK